MKKFLVIGFFYLGPAFIFTGAVLRAMPLVCVGMGIMFLLLSLVLVQVVLGRKVLIS